AGDARAGTPRPGGALGGSRPPSVGGERADKPADGREWVTHHRTRRRTQGPAPRARSTAVHMGRSRHGHTAIRIAWGAGRADGGDAPGVPRRGDWSRWAHGRADPARAHPAWGAGA